MLLANKSDVPNEAVSEAHLQKFIEQHKVKLYREVSAKTGNQVQDAFKSLGEVLMSKSKPKGGEQGKVSLSAGKSEMSHPDSPEGGTGKKCC
jgi:hypothetical protein